MKILAVQLQIWFLSDSFDKTNHQTFLNIDRTYNLQGTRSVQKQQSSNNTVL